MENKEILQNLEKMIQETFSDPKKIRSLLSTQAKMYDMSYSNVLILKSQKDNVSRIISKEEVENNNYIIKDREHAEESKWEHAVAPFFRAAERGG